MSKNTELLDSFLTFGDLLKYLRIRAHLSQRDLSIAVGYSESQISRQESNKRAPSEYTLKALFVPALGLEDEPDTITRLLVLAKKAREQDHSWQVMESEGITSQRTPTQTTYHNLQRQLSSLIGREKEIEQVVRMVREHPLVTLTGSGGVGKTRLALRIGEELLEAFQDGVWWVDLAPVIDPVFVSIAVGSIFHVQSASGQRLAQTLREFFAQKSLLLILDNCEHVIGAVVDLCIVLLQGCPNLKILATSREILGVSGEVFFRCPSLPLPEFSPYDAPSSILKKMQASEAVRLFVERAKMALPEFKLTETNAPAINSICQRLDGIPLAIELAAARLRLLSLAQITEGMDNVFQVLTGGQRVALPRHQTLRGLIDWSYQLLCPAERILLNRLSVFAGGWTLDAARMVAGGVEITYEEVLERLAQLVDKSLIFVETVEIGENRYRMLETIRQYANEKIMEAGEYQLIRDRHLAYFSLMTQRVNLPDSQRLSAQRLMKELDNIRLALDWSIKTNIKPGLRLGIAVIEAVPFNLTLELMMWLERLLTVDLATRAKEANQQHDFHHDLLRGEALLEVGEYYMLWGMRNQSERTLLEGIKIFDEIGESADFLRAVGFRHLGTLIICSDPEQSRAYLEPCRNFFLERNDIGNLSHCDRVLVALYLYTGQLDKARKLAHEGLRLSQETDGAIMNAYEYLGNVEFLLGNFDRAIANYRQGKETGLSSGDPSTAAHLVFLEARVAWAQGNSKRLQRIVGELLTIGQETENESCFLHAEAIRAMLEWGKGAYDQAAQRSEEGQLRYHATHVSWVIGLVYVLGRVALLKGELEKAEKCFRQLDDMADAPRWMWKPYSLHAFGLLAAAQASHRPDMAKRAVTLFGAQEKLFAWLPNLLSPSERCEYEQTLSKMKELLGPVDFESAWDRGQVMSHRQAFALALEERA